TSSTTVCTTSNCSAGVSEYSSPVPPAATTALIEYFSSARRFLRRPPVSSDRSALKGVTGKAITPRSLLRISSAFIRHHLHLSPAFVYHQQGRTRCQLGSTCLRISAASSRFLYGQFLYRSRPRASWSWSSSTPR